MSGARTTTANGTRGLLRNSLWNLVGTGLPLVAVVVFVPYLLRGLGDERFGLLSLILALLAYANALNLGLGKAVTQRVSRAIADGNREDVLPRAIWSATFAQFAIGLFGMVIMALIAGPIASGMDFSPSVQTEARDSLRLLGVAVPVIMVGTSFRGLLEAAERFDLANKVRAPIGLLTYSLPALAVLLDQPVSLIVVYLIACQVVYVGVMFGICLRLFPELRSTPVFSFGELRALLSFGGWIAISDLVFPMFTYIDRFLVGALAGAAKLPSYVIPHEIINRLWLVPMSLTLAVFPVASSINRDEDAERLSHLYAHGMRLMALAVIPGAAVLALFADDIIGLWISPSFADESAPLLRVFTLGLVINSTAMMASALIQGQGFPKLRAAIHLVEIPGYIVAAVVLVPTYGLIGAAWAWVFRMVITAVAIQVMLSRRLGLGMRVLRDHSLHHITVPLVAYFSLCFIAGPGLPLVAKFALGAVGIAISAHTLLRIRRSDSDASAAVPQTPPRLSRSRS